MYKIKSMYIYNKQTTMAFPLSNKVDSSMYTTSFTPESSYVLGLLWADGYICKKSNSITLQCSKEDIDYFLPIFRKTGDVNVYYKHQSLNSKISGTIHFSSKIIADFLKENDYTSKSISSPTKILSFIPKNLHKYFFLGWNDGDGCFYFSKNFTTIQAIVTSSYSQDWTALENMCRENAISYTIKRIIRSNSKYSQFQINKNKDIYLLGEYLYNSHSLGLPRKKSKYTTIKEYIDKRYSQKIHCYDKEDNLLHVFNTLKEASDWIGKSRNVSTDIMQVCKGKQSSAFGYIWKKVT